MSSRPGQSATGPPAVTRREMHNVREGEIRAPVHHRPDRHGGLFANVAERMLGIPAGEFDVPLVQQVQAPRGVAEDRADHVLAVRVGLPALQQRSRLGGDRERGDDLWCGGFRRPETNPAG